MSSFITFLINIPVFIYLFVYCDCECLNIFNSTFHYHICFDFFLFDRDMFVDESLKPKVRIFTESNLDILFNFDEHLLVSTFGLCVCG